MLGARSMLRCGGRRPRCLAGPSPAAGRRPAAAALHHSWFGQAAAGQWAAAPPLLTARAGLAARSFAGGADKLNVKGGTQWTV
eukprot:SAG22_NODE_5906_length_933_cov_1.218225_1_plen_82_part_01